MTPKIAKPLPAFGFLTAVETDQHGWLGGYLVLSLQGRPLEFRCTSPVQPSRAQEILYGNSLIPYLLSEVIGHPLLSQSQLPVLAVISDQLPMAGLSLLGNTPICMLAAPDEAVAKQAQGNDLTDSQLLDLSGTKLHLDTHNPFAAPAREHLATLNTQIELSEPFERIRAALSEAQNAAAEQVSRGDPQQAHQQVVEATPATHDTTEGGEHAQRPAA